MSPHYLTPAALRALLRFRQVAHRLRPYITSRADPRAPSRFAIFNLS